MRLTTDGKATASSPYLKTIVDAAIRRFAANGFHGTTMRDIGTEVGVHAGSLYAHISSKEELLELVIRRSARDNDDFIQSIVESDASPVDKLLRIAEAHFTHAFANPDAAVVFHNEWRHLRGDALTEAKALRARWVRMVRGIIQDGIDQGLFRSVDVRLAVLAFYGVLYSTFQPVVAGRTVSSHEMATAMVEFLIQGWGAESGPS